MKTLILSAFECTMTLTSMIFQQVCRTFFGISKCIYIFLNLFSESMYVDPKTLQS